MDELSKALLRAKTGLEVRDLVQRGADIEVRDEDGKTALFLQSSKDVALAIIKETKPASTKKRGPL